MVNTIRCTSCDKDSAYKLNRISDGYYIPTKVVHIQHTQLEAVTT